MLNKDNIEKIFTEHPELSRITYDDGRHVGLSDLVNFSLVRGFLGQEKHKRIALFRPHGCDDLYKILVAFGLEIYSKILQSGAILNLVSIKDDSLVLSDDKLYTIVKDIKDGEVVGFKLKPNDDSKATWDIGYEDDLVNLTKYFGDAKNPTQRGRFIQDMKDRRELLSDLFQISAESIKLGEYESVVVFTTGYGVKAYSDAIAGGLEAKKLFPSARMDGDVIRTMGGQDRAKIRPLFFFVSSIDELQSVLKKHKDISTIIIDGAKNVSQNFANFANFFELPANRGLKVLIVLGDIDAIRIDDLRKLSFEGLSWSRSDCEIAQKGYNELGETLKSNLKNDIHSILNNEDKFISVVYPISEIKIEEIHQQLYLISRELEIRNNSNINDVGGMMWGLLKRLIESPLSSEVLIISDLPLYNFMDNIKIKIDELVGIIPLDTIESLKIIFSNLEKLSNSFRDNTNKLNVVFNSLITENKPKVAIVIRKSIDIEKVKSIIIEMIKKSELKIPEDLIKFVTPLQAEHGDFNVIIWTCRPNKKYALSRETNGAKDIYALYPIEISQVKNDIEISRRSMESFCPILLRKELLGIDTLESEKQQQAIPLEIEPKTMGHLSIGFFDEVVELFPTDVTHPVITPYDQQVQAKIFIFSDGRYIYLRENSSIRCLNSDGNKIEKRNIDEIQLGDSLIFYGDSRLNAFEEIYKYMGHDKDAQDLIEDSRAWWYALNDFSNNNDMSISNLETALREKGLDRVPLTLQNWLAGDTICPLKDGEHDPLETIALVTQDIRLLGRVNVVRGKCKKVYRLRNQIRNYLDKRILAKLIGKTINEHLGDVELETKLNEVADYAENVEVSSIVEGLVTVPMRLIKVLMLKGETQDI